MALLTVVFDACVLYPAPLRDFLMHLALTDLFRARWTAEIHDEWIEAVLRQRPDLTRAQLQRTRRLMNAHVRDCLVTGYQALVPMLTLPDPDDRHVLAAAIHIKADLVITFNLHDFPRSAVQPYGVAAQHPDAFIARLFDQAPPAVCAAARRQRASLRKPPRSVDEYLAALGRQHLEQTVTRLRGHAAEL